MFELERGADGGEHIDRGAGLTNGWDVGVELRVREEDPLRLTDMLACEVDAGVELRQALDVATLQIGAGGFT